jgi:peroxiredoxin family protein
LKEQRGHLMTTKKQRKKYALKDETIEKIEYLLKKKQEKSKTKVYPCDVLEEVINNAYEIAKVFK